MDGRESFILDGIFELDRINLLAASSTSETKLLAYEILSRSFSGKDSMGAYTTADGVEVDESCFGDLTDKRERNELALTFEAILYYTKSTMTACGEKGGFPYKKLKIDEIFTRGIKIKCVKVSALKAVAKKNMAGRQIEVGYLAFANAKTNTITLVCTKADGNCRLLQNMFGVENNIGYEPYNLMHEILHLNGLSDNQTIEEHNKGISDPALLFRDRVYFWADYCFSPHKISRRKDFMQRCNKALSFNDNTAIDVADVIGAVCDLPDTYQNEKHDFFASIDYELSTALTDCEAEYEPCLKDKERLQQEHPEPMSIYPKATNIAEFYKKIDNPSSEININFRDKDELAILYYYSYVYEKIRAFTLDADNVCNFGYVPLGLFNNLADLTDEYHVKSDGLKKLKDLALRITNFCYKRAWYYSTHALDNLFGGYEKYLDNTKLNMDKRLELTRLLMEMKARIYVR